MTIAHTLGKFVHEVEDLSNVEVIEWLAYIKLHNERMQKK